MPTANSERTCTKCGYVGADFFKSVKTRCRSCVKASNDAWHQRNPNYMAEHAAKRREATPKRHEHMRYRYGLEPDVYASMVAERRGCCDICGEKFDPLHVDHCHTTGVVRGLLCRACNTALGSFQDNPERLRAAAAYIERAHA